MKHQFIIKRLSIFLICLQIMFVSSTFLTAKSNLDLMDLSGYKCHGATRMSTPIRINLSGNIECLSTDGKICAGNFKNDIECRKFVAKNKRNAKPVVCNANDLKDKKHWCYKAKKFFFKKWHCPHETGLAHAVKLTKKFRVKCLSPDGKRCFKGEEADKHCQKANVCYRVHKRMKFTRANKYIKKEKKKKFPYKKLKCTKDDYMAGNWCAKSWAYFRYTAGFLCNSITGLDVAVKLSGKGIVECLSKDGKECIVNLKSDYECIKTIMKLTDDNRLCPKTTQCHKDDFVKDTWCHTGFQHLYHKLPKKKLEAYRKIKNTIKNHVRTTFNYNKYRPPWIQVIRSFIKTKVARTKEGIRELRKLFKVNKVVLPKGYIKYIVRMIKRGKVSSERILRKIIKTIIGVRGKGVKIQLRISDKQCYKKAMSKLKKLMKRGDAKSDKGITRIMRFIKARFELKPSVLKFVRELIQDKDLKNKVIFKKVFQEIKDYVPMRKLRKNREKIRLEVKCDKKFFKKLKNMLKKGKAHTKKGLKKIKKFFYGHFSLKKNRWKLIKDLIKKNIVKTLDNAEDLIEKIKSVIPKKNLEKSLWIKNIHY
jgi:hypothetical protein